PAAEPASEPTKATAAKATAKATASTSTAKKATAKKAAPTKSAPEADDGGEAEAAAPADEAADDNAEESG
ncbi:MAG TPA: hypothetical protein VHK25_02105, partial [Acidimicrobiales bacterium]|nr:hypothetical protein [Acidimicrobiales bacterium]